MFGLSIRRQLSIISPSIRRSYGESFADREHWSLLDDEEKAKFNRTRKLKKWRNPTIPVDERAQFFDVSMVRESIMNKSASTDYQDWINWFKRQQLDYLRFNQKWLPERVQILGKDLALLHFLIYRKAKVRQKGTTKFLTIEDAFDVPGSYKPNWYVEEVDASGTEILYEGIENFRDINRLKIVSFRNCKRFDDWCLERLVCYCPNIEVMDVSENQGITERGIEGLYRAWNLKRLIVTDWGHGAAFELTCLMLEDCLPGLKVLIKRPDGTFIDEEVEKERLKQEQGAFAEDRAQKDWEDAKESK